MNAENRRKQLVATGRRREAVTLYTGGESRQDIAQRLQVARSTVDKYLREAVIEITDDTAELAKIWRRRSLAYIEAVITSQWEAMVDGDPHAAALVLRAVAQASKLVGLGAAPKAGLAGWEPMTPKMQAAVDGLSDEELTILAEGPRHLAEPIHQRLSRALY